MRYTNVVLIGGGFAGLNAAKALKKARASVLLIDKTNHHVFQPLLYQVASAALSPETIAAPIREIVRYQENTSVIMGTAATIHKEERRVELVDGASFPYDYLVVAAGASHSYFGHDEWAPLAPGLKTVSDALSIREKILLAFEKAERCDSISEALRLMRFVIVGGGPTGVEMAGAIAEIAYKTMFRNFRKIRPEQSQIFLVESSPRLLMAYPPDLSERARLDLTNMGVQVLLSTRVTEITPLGVKVGDRWIESSHVLWAAGNQAAPLLKTLETPLDKNGRAIVGNDLSLPGHPNIFVIGDSACVKDESGVMLPGIAAVAIQQGRYVGRLISQELPFEARPPFRYRDKGQMATIGKHKAIVMIRGWHFRGVLAWLVWSAVHVFYLIGFRHRLVVMVQWFFYYFAGQGNVRLITHPVEDTFQ